MGETPVDGNARSQPRGASPEGRPVPRPPASPASSAEDPLARLERIDGVPLADQVAVFDAIHAHLSARLTSAEN